MHFPGESAKYRAARNALLNEEMELRRHTERVAAQRRALPAGGTIPEDYRFEGEGGPIRLSELFAPGKDTLAIYSFMFGPERERPCPGCTHFLDGLDGAVEHIGQRVNLAVVANRRCRAFSASRKNVAGADCVSCRRPAIPMTATTTATRRVCRLPFGNSKSSSPVRNGTCRL